MEPMQMNGLSLAYIGDSAYELLIRKHFVILGLGKVDDLHKTVINYTCAEAQAKVIKYLLDNNMLSEEEINIYKRGRNSNANKTRKNLSKASYLAATGFESLIGYLYLTNKIDRIKELVLISLQQVGM